MRREIRPPLRRTLAERPMPVGELAGTILADYLRGFPVELAPAAAKAHSNAVAHAG